MTLVARVRAAGRVLAGRDAGLPRVILVLGSQRSGTNALRRSLSMDPYVMGFNERHSNALYERYRLRPLDEIVPFLRRIPARHTVLLKPIQSVEDQPLASFLAGLAPLDLAVAWLYRDPVNVHASRKRRWAYLHDPDRFARAWNRTNSRAVKAAAGDPRIHVVRYEDVAADRAVFRALCERLGVRGEYVFAGVSNAGYRHLPADEIERITAACADTLAALDAVRVTGEG